MSRETLYNIVAQKCADKVAVCLELISQEQSLSRKGFLCHEIIKYSIRNIRARSKELDIIFNKTMKYNAFVLAMNLALMFYQLYVMWRK